jgi:hypothetical protein
MERLKLALADRYTIERELGGDSMAIVYLSDGLQHNRQVGRQVWCSQTWPSSEHAAALDCFSATLQSGNELGR